MATACVSEIATASESGEKTVKALCVLGRARKGVTRRYENMVEVDFS
jgi:hypothetical protein